MIMLTLCRCSVCGFEATCNPDMSCLKTGSDCEGSMIAAPADVMSTIDPSWGEDGSGPRPKGWDKVETSTEAPKNTVHIIMENEGGNYSPALVTTSIEKARAKYIELMKGGGSLARDLIPRLTGICVEDDGYVYGHLSGSQAIKLDDIWYDCTDDAGDKLALWFIEEVVD